MTTLVAHVKRRLPVTAAIAAGVIGFTLLPLDAYESVTQELIALFGLMMAGVLPTMVITASVLRAGNLSVKRLIAYRDGLRAQLILWIGLFFVSLVTCLMVIFGKMAEWSVSIYVPMAWLRMSDLSFDAVRFVNGMISLGIALVVFRAISVGNGVITLLHLSAELAISDARMRDESAHKRTEDSIKNMAERPDFGSFVDLKH